jgi:hypothetical protein
MVAAILRASIGSRPCLLRKNTRATSGPACARSVAEAGSLPQCPAACQVALRLATSMRKWPDLAGATLTARPAGSPSRCLCRSGRRPQAAAMFGGEGLHAGAEEGPHLLRGDRIPSVRPSMPAGPDPIQAPGVSRVRCSKRPARGTQARLCRLDVTAGLGRSLFRWCGAGRQERDGSCASPRLIFLGPQLTDRPAGSIPGCRIWTIGPCSWPCTIWAGTGWSPTTTSPRRPAHGAQNAAGPECRGAGGGPDRTAVDRC